MLKEVEERTPRDDVSQGRSAGAQGGKGRVLIDVTDREGPVEIDISPWLWGENKTGPRKDVVLG